MGLENKIKIEDRKRMKEEKSLTEQIKKKTGKATQKGKDKTEDSSPKDTKQSKMTDVKKRKTETTKSNLSDGSKFVILAKKSPPKQKVKNDSIRPFTPIAKKAHGTPVSQTENEKKIEHHAAKVGLQRRNSIPKHKEQWVVLERIKTPSPTPPNMPAPFVAKKSRPDETVSFSLPAGGFNSSSGVQSKPKPLLMQVDELFSQYFPGVKEDMKAVTETPDSKNIDNANEKQLTFEQKRTFVEVILEELLLRVVKISLQTKLNSPRQNQQETKSLNSQPKDRSRSREVSPNSPIRSRNVSADSSKGGFNFNSNESSEAHKEEYIQSDKDISNKPKKRKSENLDSEDESLNGGYWD